MKDLQYYIDKFDIGNLFEVDMSPYMSLQYFSKGEKIVSVGDIMEYFYFIVEGKVKIFLTLENGK